VRIALVLACLVATAAALAAPVPKAVKQRPDADVLVGTWETVVSEENGRARAGPGVYRWTFDADLTMWSGPAGQTERGVKWVVKIAPGQSPKEIDLTNGSTAHKGIYEVDRDDLRIAYTPGERPANFTARPGVYYNVLRRVPDKK
jgi:uncharacterized protein (TIGR03067 family)